MMLGHETNILQIIRSRRFFAEALQMLLNEEQRKVLLERSRYVVFDPDIPLDTDFDLLKSSRLTAQDKKDKPNIKFKRASTIDFKSFGSKSLAKKVRMAAKTAS